MDRYGSAPSILAIHLHSVIRVPGGAALWLATQHPLAFGIALAMVLVISIALLVVLMKFFKALLRRISAWFGGTQLTQLR